MAETSNTTGPSPSMADFDRAVELMKRDNAREWPSAIVVSPTRYAWLKANGYDMRAFTEWQPIPV